MHASIGEPCILKMFDCGEQGRFYLKICNGFVVRGKHICTERVIDHAAAYPPEGVPIRFRALSLTRAVLFCPECGARVVFSVDIRKKSCTDLEQSLQEATFFSCHENKKI